MTLLELPFVDPFEAASCLAGRQRLSFLDSAMTHESLGRWSYLASDPVGVFRVVDGTASWNGVASDGPPLDMLRAVLREFHREPVAGGPPFKGGAIGYLSYEAGRLFERLPRTQSAARPFAQVDLAFYDTVLAVDVVDKRAFIAARDHSAASTLRDLLAAHPACRAAVPTLTWHDSRSRADYEAEVARVVGYVREGDIFQANLSHRFSARPERPVDPIAIYGALRRANPAPFSALLVDGERLIASTSPERFLALSGRDVEARPIKGTRRRGSNPARDAELARELAASEKDRAENVMIVDLLRNDLSRVCLPGSVEVPVLCGVESYASVHHLTSVVTGRLRPGLGIVDLVAASFPGGSITGAPKIRAMEIIAELEREDRGIYCGSIGWIGFDGCADLNIAIRTMSFDGETLSIGAGGGITLLSKPDEEYEETLAKAERLFQPLQGPAQADEEAAA